MIFILIIYDEAYLVWNSIKPFWQENLWYHPFPENLFFWKKKEIFLVILFPELILSSANITNFTYLLIFHLLKRK